MNPITRREFGRAAALAGVTLASGAASAQTTPATRKSPARPATRPPASERIRVGFIGIGNRGDSVLNAFLAQADVDVVALCDIYAPYLDAAAKRVGGDAAQFRDYRELLDRKDIHAVVINTPDHWHALQMIHACQAGKDVYIEKPLSLCVTEGRAMVEAAAKYKRVTQVGIQRRSSPACREMAEFIRGGGIGKVTVARAFHIQNEWPNGIGRPEDSDPPADLDWDAWLGPAPLKPYNKNRTLYRFRWFFDYSGGQLTNMGVHYMDLIQWALDKNAPQSVAALGGKFGDYDNREIPDTMEAMWTYPGGTLVTFSQFNATGVGATARPAELEFRGTKGTIYFRAGGWEVVPENVAAREFPVLSPIDRAASRGWRDGKPMIEPKTVAGQADPTGPHARNFVDCVKSRKPCVCDIETGHRSTSATLLANIALRTRATLDWDAQGERFTNNEAANKLLAYEYRKPYELPAIG